MLFGSDGSSVKVMSFLILVMRPPPSVVRSIRMDEYPVMFGVLFFVLSFVS